ncbi:hypothetical protein [Chryseobacterium lactis]|uniref:hypothetical protein n=1 Tax=Chryseobacterium lactis TaxID=1241981 RepID=UPI0016253872|nr:hypothetical protein [Chryseobacterium lactis]
MKFGLLFVTVISLSRCTSERPEYEFVKEGFITTNGIYAWGTEKKIMVKNLENASKIFAITDERGKILYQQPLNATFSDNHYWLCYADDKENLYYYNSDYSEAKALIWNPELKKYEEKNFCSTQIHLPEKFKDELKNKATLTDCMSLK